MAAMAMATSSRASPPANLKNAVVAALLCASFLPLSSAGVSLVSRTCSRTAHERLCIATLGRERRSDAAGSVQELAVIALTAARNATLEAAWRATRVPAAATTTPVERGRLAECRALYSECLRETTRTVELVTAASYDDAARAASALPSYPEKCQSLLHTLGVEAAMERTNKKVEEKLIAYTDLVHLLLARRVAEQTN